MAKTDGSISHSNVRVDKGTPVAVIPHYTIPLHNHLNGDDGTANSQCQVVGPLDQLPDSQSSWPLLVRSSGVLSESIAFLSCPSASIHPHSHPSNCLWNCRGQADVCAYGMWRW